MQLNDYPAAIAELRRALADTRQDLRFVKDVAEILSAEAEKTIVCENLKNDGQRKVRKAELLAHPADAAIDESIKDLQGQIGGAEISIEFFLNNFSVLKLETRERVADKMLAAGE